jgi:transmembrane sensor
MTGAEPGSSVLGLAPDEAASYWTVRLAEGFSDCEQVEFDAWLASSSANANAFGRAKRAWDMFETAGEDPHLSALREAALAVGPEPWRRWWLGLGVGIAASLLAVVGVKSLMFAPQTSPRIAVAAKSALPSNHRKGGSQSQFSTDKGERRTIQLMDGTALTLNTDSAVRIEYSPSRRFVTLLRGQVLFQVAKDHSRPFVVQVADRQVTALGTVFEVTLETNRTKVMLVEGKVVVDDFGGRPSKAATTAPIMLKPGQELIANSGSVPQLGSVDVEQQLRWREGFVEFDDVALADAVREVNRYSQRQIVVRDADVGKLQISGIFRTGDPDRFCAIVSELLPVRSQGLPENRLELIAGKNAL